MEEGERGNGCFASRVVDAGCPVPWSRINSDVPVGSAADCFAYLATTNKRGYGTTMTKEVAQDQTSALQNTIQYNKAPNRRAPGVMYGLARTYSSFLIF